MSNYEQRDDTIREENEQTQLVQDLHNLYDTRTSDAQSLSRIRSRLLQRASIPLPDGDDDNIITFQSLDAHEKRESETVASTTTRRLNEWRNARRHWPRLVSEIAALILVTALLGSIVLVFSLRPHAPAHNGLVPSNPNGVVQRIQMIDANTGWAEVQTKHGNNIDPAPAIMRTTDGGHTWYDVTPPESYNVSTGQLFKGTPMPSSNQGVIVGEAAFQPYFLSGNDAWAALVSPEADSTPLSFTHDGGKTWQESSIPINNIKQMSFIDAQHGWVLTELPPVSTLDDADVESVALFQTVNGGETWTDISQASFDRQLNDTTIGSLPTSGIKVGFTFINAQTGWMVGQTQHNNFFWFYVTHDGGRTWQHQNLPQPQPAIRPRMTDAGPQFQLQLPVFFGNEGVLAFTIPTDGKYATSSNTANNETVEIYVSHDGGNTWQSTPSPLSTNSIHSGIFSNVQFMDATHGSVSMNNEIFFVHRSTNSDSWTVTSTTIHGEVLQSNFVSSTTGWAIIDAVPPNSYAANPDDQWLLYQTTDGGKSWTQVNYNVKGQQVQTTQKLNAGWVAVASYSGTGSKVMFLHGQIAPSKQWALVYTLSCTAIGSFKTTMFDTQTLSTISNGGSISGDAFSQDCPGETNKPQPFTSTSLQNTFTIAGVQVQTVSSATWNFLVVECTNSQGCKGSPIE